MANEHTILSTKFYNQYRNGIGFTLNLGDSTNKLQGNTGEIVQLVEEIEVRTIVNETISIPMTFHELPFATIGKFSAPGIDFIQEGLFAGVTVQVEFDGQTATNVQVQQVTGVSNSEWTFDATDTAAIKALLNNLDAGGNEQRTDFVFKVTQVPNDLTYDYAVIPNSFTGTPTYQSPLDTNTQSYKTNVTTIPTTPTTTPMPWIGNQIGSSLGDVKVSFIQTLDTYRHSFRITHTFKIPYYIQGQQANLNDGSGNPANPPNLLSSNSLRYDNRYSFGATALTAMVFTNQGNQGNVGYFGENFNGLATAYTVENVVITNASASGTLEASEANTVTFDVVSTGGNWTVGSDQLIFTHSKIPTAAEYANSNTAYDTNWIFENIISTEGAAPVVGTSISGFEFSVDGGDPARLNVTLIINYSGAQQLLITSTSEFLMYVTVAHNNLTNPDLVDRVNPIVKTDFYSANTDVSGLLTNFVMKFFPAYSAYAGVNRYDDFNGGIGDLWGCEFSFTTDISKGALVETFRYIVLLENPSTLERFELLSIPISIGKIGTHFDGTNTHQLENTDIQGAFNLPSTEALNRLQLDAAKPPLASATQDWTGRLGFQVPHRDWIENTGVNSVFYDVLEPNNNLNEKTSNYAGVDGFVCYGVIEMSIRNDVQAVSTIYERFSNACTILDFDAAGWTAGFTGTVSFEDEFGDPVTEIDEVEDYIVVIDFDHALGVIILADIEGFVWAERKNSTVKPWFLSTSRDWTNGNSTIKPTDTLMTGNNTLVEVITIANKVTFKFQTEHNNIDSPLDYNFMGRLWNAK